MQRGVLIHEPDEATTLKNSLQMQQVKVAELAGNDQYTAGGHVLATEDWDLLEFGSGGGG